MATIQCDIVSAEGSIFSGAAEMVIATGEMGDLGVSVGHSPLLTGLKPGPVRVLANDDEVVFYVSGGFLEVQPNVVTVLADTAARGDDLDEAAAIEAQRAPSKLWRIRCRVRLYPCGGRTGGSCCSLRTIQQIKRSLDNAKIIAKTLTKNWHRPPFL